MTEFLEMFLQIFPDWFGFFALVGPFFWNLVKSLWNRLDESFSPLVIQPSPEEYLMWLDEKEKKHFFSQFIISIIKIMLIHVNTHCYKFTLFLRGTNTFNIYQWRW